MTRFFADSLGNYLGGFDGQTAAELKTLLPLGAVETMLPPAHGLDKWNGTAWVRSPETTAALALGELRASDASMARIAEDVAVAMLTGTPLPLAAKDKINARRVLRGEAPIP